MTDQELAMAMAHGNREALSMFVRLFHPSVFRYMRSLVHGHEDAEDLAIETMTQAHPKIASYRGNASLKTWVHRVAYHQFTHWKRKHRPTESLDGDLASHDRPYDSIDDAEMLRDSLLRLPDSLRHPFVLHEINELTLDEISTILRIPVGTVKSRLHFARAKLRELLAPEEHELKTHLSSLPSQLESFAPTPDR